jgi:hypothetical protein
MTFVRDSRGTLRDEMGVVFNPDGLLRISLNGGAEETFVNHKTHAALLEAATAGLKATAQELERAAGERQQRINALELSVAQLLEANRLKADAEAELARIRGSKVGAGMSAAEIRKMDPCVLEAEWAFASEAAPFRDSEPLRYCLILREALARRAEREVVWAGKTPGIWPMKPQVEAPEAIGDWPDPIGDLAQCRSEYARVVAELDKIKRHRIASGKTAAEIRAMPREVFADEVKDILGAMGQTFGLDQLAREVLARRAEREAAATIYAPPVQRSHLEWILRDVLGEIAALANDALEEKMPPRPSEAGPGPDEAAPGEPA